MVAVTEDLLRLYAGSDASGLAALVRAGEVTPADWYRVLARPRVEIGRSNPDTDPSGYQTVQMLSLAETYYKAPGLAARILGNSPPANMRDTETSLIAALQLGQIDYLAIYRSDALQHGFRYLQLPAAIDLSDPRFAGTYKEALAHTENGALQGRPIADQIRRQEFQCYGSAELYVLCLVHNSHPAAAQFLNDAVVRNDLPNERIADRHSAAILGCALKTSQRTVACREKREQKSNSQRAIGTAFILIRPAICLPLGRKVSWFFHAYRVA